MDLFGEILENSGILLEKSYKKKKKKKLKPQPKQRKVLKPNASSNIVMSNGEQFKNDINTAIDNLYPVVMNYNSGGENLATGERTIYPIAYGLSKANNPVVRAFEPKGDTVRGVPKWKFFRVDRILNWENIEDERFDPRQLNGVNETGDMLMTRVFNIAPIGNGKKIDKTHKFIRLTPGAISKNDIEAPNIENNKTYSADSVINDIIRNMEQNNQEDDENVYNVPEVSYNQENQPSNKLEAPETKPISKQEIQGGDKPVNPETENNDETEIEKMTADDKAISKDEIENQEPQENKEDSWINRARSFYNNMLDRMNNLYK